MDAATTQTSELAHPMDNPPAGVPSMDGMGESDLASLLERSNQGGSETPAKVSPPVPGEEEKGKFSELFNNKPEAPVQTQVPDKFKNPDGTLNTDNLIKSYGELEKNFGRGMQAQNELKQAQSRISQMEQKMQELYQKGQAPQAQPVMEELSEEQQAELLGDPKKMNDYINSRIDKTVTGKIESIEQKRANDMNIIAAANRARQELPLFGKYESEIQKILADGDLPYRPESLQIGYNAFLGQNLPQILVEAKNMAYNEGFQKAKAELGLHVEAGGKASGAIDGQGFNPDQIDNMSLEELEKIAVNHGI